MWSMVHGAWVGADCGLSSVQISGATKVVLVEMVVNRAMMQM